MARIFNILTGDGIEIPDDLIIRNDDYVSIEIRGGFNWGHHSRTCNECNSFRLAFGTESRKWFIDLFGEKKIVDLSTFDKPDNYFANLYMYINSKEFWGSKLKFKVSDPSISELDSEREHKASIEKYEDACELRDVIKELRKT